MAAPRRSSDPSPPRITSRPYTGNAELIRLSSQLALDYDSLCRLDDVPVGLPVDVLRKVPIMLRTPVGEQCPICLSEYDWLDDAVELPCKHRYHHDCVVEWLGKHKSCCVCKKEVTPVGLGIV